MDVSPATVDNALTGPLASSLCRARAPLLRSDWLRVPDSTSPDHGGQGHTDPSSCVGECVIDTTLTVPTSGRGFRCSGRCCSARCTPPLASAPPSTSSTSSSREYGGDRRRRTARRRLGRGSVVVPAATPCERVATQLCSKRSPGPDATFIAAVSLADSTVLEHVQLRRIGVLRRRTRADVNQRCGTVARPTVARGVDVPRVRRSPSTLSHRGPSGYPIVDSSQLAVTGGNRRLVITNQRSQQAQQEVDDGHLDRHGVGHSTEVESQAAQDEGRRGRCSSDGSSDDFYQRNGGDLATTVSDSLHSPHLQCSSGRTRHLVIVKSNNSPPPSVHADLVDDWTTTRVPTSSRLESINDELDRNRSTTVGTTTALGDSTDRRRR